VHVRLVLARRPLRVRTHSLRPRSRPLHEDDPRRQSQERPDRRRQACRDAPRRTVPDGVRLSEGQAADPRPVASPQLLRPPAQLIAHIVNTNSQFNLPPLAKKLSYAANRSDGIAERFEHPSTQLAISADLALIDGYDAQIAELERHLIKNAKVDDPVTFGLLRSVPGIGPILGLVLLYEIDTIARFPEAGNFLSYSRLVRCSHESAGKVKGSGGKKIGNAHLKWAFSEAACLMLRSSPRAKAWMQRQEKKRGKRKALAVLEAKLGRAVYHLWKKQVPFDARRFLTS
jgi:transposase